MSWKSSTSRAFHARDTWFYWLSENALYERFIASSGLLSLNENATAHRKAINKNNNNKTKPKQNKTTTKQKTRQDKTRQDKTRKEKKRKEKKRKEKKRKEKKRKEKKRKEKKNKTKTKSASVRVWIQLVYVYGRSTLCYGRLPMFLHWCSTSSPPLPFHVTTLYLEDVDMIILTCMNWILEGKHTFVQILPLPHENLKL